MATWPVKNNYLAGAVLTATQMNETGNAINPLGFTAGKNKIINGDFGIWQRGTSISYTGSAAVAYSADRWYHYTNGNGSWTFSRQTFTPGTAPVTGYEAVYFARASLPTAGTTTAINWGQRIEDVQTFAGQTVTISFWAKADSARSFNFAFEQNFGSGGSSTVTTNGSNISVTTSWARYSTTLTVPSISGKTIGTSSYLSVYINNGAVSNGFILDIWGVQLEAAGVTGWNVTPEPTPFQTATGTKQGELAACQRYYWRFGGQDSNQVYGLGIASSTTTAIFPIQNPVPMRTAPTSIDFSTLGTSDLTAFTNSISTLTIGVAANNAVRLTAGGGSGMTLKSVVALQSTAIGGYLGISAEL